MICGLVLIFIFFVHRFVKHFRRFHWAGGPSDPPPHRGNRNFEFFWGFPTTFTLTTERNCRKHTASYFPGLSWVHRSTLWTPRFWVSCLHPCCWHHPWGPDVPLHWCSPHPWGHRWASQLHIRELHTRTTRLCWPRWSKFYLILLFILLLFFRLEIYIQYLFYYTVFSFY